MMTTTQKKPKQQNCQIIIQVKLYEIWDDMHTTQKKMGISLASCRPPDYRFAINMVPQTISKKKQQRIIIKNNGKLMVQTVED